MPGELNEGLTAKKDYYNDQHKKAMNAPINLEDDLRKKGLI
jgi:hypothetical protein